MFSNRIASRNRESAPMTDEALLISWTKPSSETEQENQDRTERMIRDAINEHQAFNNCSVSVYAKGSYPNNTNVRAESDVDIAVQCSETFYYKLDDPSIPKPGPPYEGIWTPKYLRSEVKKALDAKFGSQVDASGNVAIKVSPSTARVDADVVPCFDYRQYFTSDSYREGARIYRKDDSYAENYSQQHLAKGRAKNTSTNRYYKRAVRILKRASNAMETDGHHREVASFLVESLAYNCPDALFLLPTWSKTIREVVAHIWENTKAAAEPITNSERWVEANDVKYLFHSSQSWNRKDARDFAYAAWNYLKLADL